MNQRKQAKRAWMDVLAGYREKNKSAKAGCKKWGKLPLIRYFSDFLIIKLVKEERKTRN